MASIIDPELAKSLIQKYQAQNLSRGDSALKTTDGENLNGFIIDRMSLEAILKNPDITDISISLSKDPNAANSPENIYTIVFVGVIADASEDKPLTATGDMYSNIPTCPPWCPKL